MFAGQPTEDAMSVFHKLSDMPGAFPDLLACLQLALTIPVSSTSAERSFSTMRRVKTHLRSSMADSRLSNLVLIAVERRLSDSLMQNPDKVIDAFCQLADQPRRLKLQL